MDPALYERILDPRQPPLVIAEAGINHNGSIDAARQLVIEAARCGADVIKFQTHLPEHEMLRQGFTADYVKESLFDLLSRMVLTKAHHQELIELARSHKIAFLSTPFSREAADLLDELGVPLFKIGSGEATNIPLLRHIARKNKPMIISTGMTALDEVKESVDAVKEINSRIVLLHCTSTYPTAYRDVRLNVMEQLRRRFPGIPIGLSDHSTGVYTALGATALGARVLEKHFTISRQWEGPDQSASIEPSELAEMVKGSRAIHEALQVSDKQILEEEKGVQKMARESIVTLADIQPGEVLSEKNTWVKRPGTGIPAREYTKVLGKKARKLIKCDSLVSWQDLD